MSILNMASCSCYLSKTHFLLDFLENSIGNSCNSTLAIPFAVRERSLSYKQQCNSIGNLSTKPTPLATPFPLQERSSIFQNTVEFCRPQETRNTGGTPFTMRNRSENDPSVIRPHTRPSRNRRTAEIDQRGSGRVFVWRNAPPGTVSHPSHRRSRSWMFGTYFVGKKHMVSCSCSLSKRISCETSCNTRSATPPRAPLAIPFTVREQFL